MSEMLEADFYALIDEDDNREFLGGRLVVSEPASNRHEDIFGFLLFLLRGFLEERGAGLVRGSHYPMRLDEKWSPEPDLLVVREERRHLMRTQRLEGPADLVIEITSGSKPRADIRLKLPRYREAKIPEIWLIDPYASSIRVEILESEGYRTATHGAGRLAAAVIPGFWLDVAWLWQEPLPPAASCLRQILA